jgi:hypothetical protein
VDDLATQLGRRLTNLKAARQWHESVWRDCFDYTFPERGHGFQGSVVTASSAQAQKASLTDSTATDSSRTLASNLMSGLTPANSRWFDLEVGEGGDQEDAESRWLANAADVIFKNIHAGNFDAAAFEACVDVTCAGWFVLYIDSPPDGGYMFEQWPIAQCYVASSKSSGLIDTIYREFEYTVEQMVAEYGIDQVSDKVREAHALGKLDDKVQMLHAIYPRAVHVVGAARVGRNKAFASCHMEVNTRKLVRESGYDEFPCAVPRWMLIPASTYATGPVSNALPDIKTLNEITRMELCSLDIAISGMWKAVDDGVLNPRSVKVGPRKIITVGDPDSIQPLQTGVDFKVGFTKAEMLERKIRKLLLADVLQPQDGPAMTATEVHARMQLVRQMLGPIYGRLQAEYLQPLIARCFGLAYRAGVLGQAPDSLRGRAFAVKYISPLARSQKLEEVTAIDNYVAGALQVAEAKPDVLDNIDFDAAARIRGEALGVPVKVMRPADEVKALREARARQQEQAQQQAMQQQVMVDAAGAAAQQAAKAA